MELPPLALGRDDAKEEAILQAAREAFLEFGYADTSMDVVAQKARASKTTLYTRFPSKQALFAETMTAVCAARGMYFTPEDLAGISVEEALRRIGRRFVDLMFSVDAIRMEQLVMAESAKFPEVAEVFFREGPERLVRAVAGYLAALDASGALAIPDPAFAAGQFLCAFKGVDQTRLLLSMRPTPTDAERDAFVEKAVALFLNGALPRSMSQDRV